MTAVCGVYSDRKRQGNDVAYMIGRVAVAEIQNLIVAYKERFDKSNFIQNLILDNLLLVDVYNRAKKTAYPGGSQESSASGRDQK